MEVKRVGPWSVARVCGTMYAAMGLIFGAVFACIALVGGIISPRNSDASVFGTGFGLGAMVLLPDNLWRARRGVRRSERLVV